MALIVFGSVSSASAADMEVIEIPTAPLNYSSESPENPFYRQPQRTGLFQNARRATISPEEYTRMSELDEAKALRLKNFVNKHLIRNNWRKDVRNQELIHQNSLYRRNVSQNPNSLDRTGELRTVPDYDERRTVTTPSYVRPNSKQTFRARAINYYLEGGDAGPSEMYEDGVIRDYENHEVWVNQRKDPATQQLADIINSVRQVQKQRTRRNEDFEAEGTQRFAPRSGDSRRQLLHPYMNPVEVEQ